MITLAVSTSFTLPLFFSPTWSWGSSLRPVGVNLFLSSYRFNKPMAEVIHSVVPMMIVLLLGVLLISYVPFLTTALPHLVQAVGGR